MRRYIVGNNPDGTPIYEYEKDTVVPDLCCARDADGVPVSEAGRLQDSTSSAPTAAGASADVPATPRSRSKIKE